jgi:hypothetical protein
MTVGAADANEARLTAIGKRRGKASSLNTVLFATRLTTPTTQQRTPYLNRGVHTRGYVPPAPTGPIAVSQIDDS